MITVTTVILSDENAIVKVSTREFEHPSPEACFNPLKLIEASDVIENSQTGSQLPIIKTEVQTIAGNVHCTVFARKVRKSSKIYFFE